MYEKQQQKINHLMSYVNRFRFKASKAKQAQSRLNAIAKMDITAQAQVDSPFSFSFYPCQRASNPLLRCEDVSAGYDPNVPVLKTMNLAINPGDRIALLGPNGEGKSTLIKTLTGSIPPLAGSIFRSPNLQIGYYAQHQLDELDYQLSPVDTIQALSPEAREQTVRDYLGGFNFLGDMALKPIHHFSGGEKARLALAKLVWLKPNLLLLDEPTNHLDLAMRAAIEIALQSYEGALILISHDRHLLRTTVDDFYLVYQQRAQAFKGDLSDYYQWLLTRPAGIFSSKESANLKDLPVSANLKDPHPSLRDTFSPREETSGNLYREKKLLQNRSKKLEQITVKLHQDLAQLEETLADSSLYEEGQQQKLHRLLDQQKKLERELLQTEEEWLEVVNALEAL